MNPIMLNTETMYNEMICPIHISLTQTVKFLINMLVKFVADPTSIFQLLIIFRTKYCFYFYITFVFPIMLSRPIHTK